MHALPIPSCCYGAGDMRAMGSLIWVAPVLRIVEFEIEQLPIQIGMAEIDRRIQYGNRLACAARRTRRSGCVTLGGIHEPQTGRTSIFAAPAPGARI